MPLDPALMQGAQPDLRLADLPPSPFLTALDQNGDAQLDGLDLPDAPDAFGHTPGPERRAPTARAEMRRRLDRVARYGRRKA
jgi:hypothetical protein